MTIFRLYAQNGDRAGFWVQHRTWANACARVQSIAGRQSGPLPGAPPAHDDSEIVVQTFDVRSGRPVHSPARGPVLFDRNFCQIAEPWWFHEAALKESLGASVSDHPAD